MNEPVWLRQPAGGPRSGPGREWLRQKGQFWTPDWLADAMVAYVLEGGSPLLFDPAVGSGAFFAAARRWSARTGRAVALRGVEIDPKAIEMARKTGLPEADLGGVAVGDFVLEPPLEKFAAIVANPPYIRHHRLSPETKARLRHWSRTMLGWAIDGRAGLHVYFLLRCLDRLAPGGRLAFIVSADICEGVFAGRLWEWMGRRFRLEAVVTFDAQATPFPDVDTNALLFLIRHDPPVPELWWARYSMPNPVALREWVVAPTTTWNPPGLRVWRRSLAEAQATGLSRPPAAASASRYRLGDFARVMRGIVTGDNEFFFLTRAQATASGIPPSFLVPAVGRTRDVSGDELTPADLDALEARGRPTLLLSIPHRRLEALPEILRRYLQQGELRGLPDKPLIRTRRPWWRVETRRVPPLLFAYLGRRNSRFIRNRAGVVPLTGLLCVYPHDDAPAAIERLGQVLRHPRTVANLRLVGKSYGGDAIKVEPRALEQLPLPEDVVEAAGLTTPPAIRAKPLELTFT